MKYFESGIFKSCSDDAGVQKQYGFGLDRAMPPIFRIASYDAEAASMYGYRPMPSHNGMRRIVSMMAPVRPSFTVILQFVLVTRYGWFIACR